MWILGCLSELLKYIYSDFFFFYCQVTPAPSRLSWSWKKLYGSMNLTKIQSSLFTVSLHFPTIFTQTVFTKYTVSAHTLCRLYRPTFVLHMYIFSFLISYHLRNTALVASCLLVINLLMHRFHYENIIFIDFLKFTSTWIL